LEGKSADTRGEDRNGKRRADAFLGVIADGVARQTEEILDH
jgi:hypothetical protein